LSPIYPASINSR